MLNEEIRVYCKYSVKEGLPARPGSWNVHGWMGAPNVNQEYVNNGWAVMAHDYCGKTGNRAQYTKYPERLRHGNMDDKFGPVIHDSTPDHKSITDPKQTSEYLWYAIERRVLSYLEQQKEVDKTRLGATGYSYGGTLMWALGTDPRVKAIVAHFGIGWIEYYRNKQVWMYNDPYVEPPKSSGEEIFLAGMAPEAYVPYITAATLFLNGSNDHHGGHERGLESFKCSRTGVPWAFAVQARGHHNTEKIEQDCKLWLDKYVLGKEVFWPEHPKSEIRLDNEGVPELIVTPASPERVKKVEMYYALKNPVSFTRSWRDTACIQEGRHLGWQNAGDAMSMIMSSATPISTMTRRSSYRLISTPRSPQSSARQSPPTSEIRCHLHRQRWNEACGRTVAEVEGPKGIKGFRSTE